MDFTVNKVANIFVLTTHITEITGIGNKIIRCLNETFLYRYLRHFKRTALWSLPRLKVSPDLHGIILQLCSLHLVHMDNKYNLPPTVS
jgi:hypothetical protein